MNIKIDYTVPEELGADRIVNAAAAYSIYGGPCITVDFGSATTFGIIDENGHFMGGRTLIAPRYQIERRGPPPTRRQKLPRIGLYAPSR